MLLAGNPAIDICRRRAGGARALWHWRRRGRRASGGGGTGSVALAAARGGTVGGGLRSRRGSSSSGSSGFRQFGQQLRNWCSGGLTHIGGAGGGGTELDNHHSLVLESLPDDLRKRLFPGRVHQLLSQRGFIRAPNANPADLRQSCFTPHNHDPEHQRPPPGAASNTAGGGFGTVGIPRTPAYTTVLNEDLPFKTHSRAGVVRQRPSGSRADPTPPSSRKTPFKFTSMAARSS